MFVRTTKACYDYGSLISDTLSHRAGLAYEGFNLYEVNCGSRTDSLRAYYRTLLGRGSCETSRTVDSL